MKKICNCFWIIILSLLSVGKLAGQILFQPQLPSMGVIQQNQLWSVLIINNGANSLNGAIKITFQEEGSGSKIFTGTSGQLLIPVGASQITSSNAGAIHYDYSGGMGLSSINGGLLPIGRFVVCYSLVLVENKIVDAPGMECLPLTVEPFSPPQLVYPENKSLINTRYPVLNWIPPMPLNMFTNLNYKLIISQVNIGQAPSLAIQRNPLLYVQDQIRQTSFVYPSSYVALEQGKTYAWQIIAQNGSTYSQASDVWSFSIQKDSLLIKMDNTSFPHMQRGAGSAMYSVEEKIKFSYENEAGDSLVTLKLTQINGSSQQLLNEVPIHLIRGINFIDISLDSFKKLIEGQDYLLEFTNGWKEKWGLKFRYEPSHN